MLMLQLQYEYGNSFDEIELFTLCAVYQVCFTLAIEKNAHFIVCPMQCIALDRV